MPAFDLPALTARLEALADEPYRKFNESLIPGSENTSLGVRLPQLRAVAKELCRDDWRSFLTAAEGQTLHELVLLRGLVIASARCSLEERLSRTMEFLPSIQNWAVCDTFCNTWKDAQKNPDAVLPALLPLLQSEAPYTVRFAVVMLMDYFITPEYHQTVLDACMQVRHQDYYVKMAVAWALSVCFVKYREETLPLLEGALPDPWTRRKAIQKCLESYRVTPEDKALLRRLRETQPLNG